MILHHDNKVSGIVLDSIKNHGSSRDPAGHEKGQTLCPHRKDPEENDSPSGTSLFRNVFYILLCLLVIGINVVLIGSDVKSPAGNGWDFKVYMGASASVADGKDPYIPHYSDIGLHYAYPPFTLALFQPMYALYTSTGSMNFYYLVQLLMLLFAAVFLVRACVQTDYLLLTALLASAFASTHWNFLTGNFALVYLVLAALFFYFLIRERFLLSALVMGVFAAFSLFPVLFNGLYLALKTSWRERVIIILLSLGVSAAILILSYCMNPLLFLSFVRLVSGTAGPAYEGGGRYTPTLYYFVKDMVDAASIPSPLISDLALLCFIGGVLAALVIFFKKNRGDPVALYSFVFLAIFVLMPRVKPYYFAMLIVPVYLLVKDSDIRAKIIAIAIVSLFPALCTQTLWGPVPFLPDLIVGYCQPISLLAFMVFLLLNPWDKNGEKKPDVQKA
jgi:hypothetical protein